MKPGLWWVGASDGEAGAAGCHAGSAVGVLVAVHCSVLDARNGYIRNVVV